jgi:hypothetical protein
MPARFLVQAAVIDTASEVDRTVLVLAHDKWIWAIVYRTSANFASYTHSIHPLFQRYILDYFYLKFIIGQMHCENPEDRE